MYSSSQDTDHLLQRATYHHQRGELVPAAAFYRATLARDATQAEAWHGLGVLTCQAGDAVQAAMFIQHAIARQTQEPRFYYSLGNVLLQQGDAAAAAAAYQRTVQLAPACFEAYHNLGILLSSMNRRREAVLCHCKVTTLCPHHAEALELARGFAGGPRAALRAAVAEDHAAWLEVDGLTLAYHDVGEGPPVVLLHGSGPALRDSLRPHAEAFARLGVATLIYDKRTDGYSQIERSYALLADDALAAVAALRDQRRVDPSTVGLWGLSEGGWVAPIAASGSADVAFVVTVGASGVPPLQQTGWAIENNLDDQGVSGSLRRTVATTGPRVLAGIGVFAEAYHDPVAPLERLEVPLLAIWGDRDRTAPPGESARITAKTIDSIDGHVTVRIFGNAGHGRRISNHSTTDDQELAPGYPEAVTDWIHAIADGHPMPAHRDPFPQQARASRPLRPLAWWESRWVQLAGVVIPLATFLFIIARETRGVIMSRRRRFRPAHMPTVTPWLPLTVAGCGLATLIGFFPYYGYLVFLEASDVGPLLAGRSVVWLGLQLLAIAACGLNLLLAATTWKQRASSKTGSRAGAGAIVPAGLVLTAWAAYWGLLWP